MVSTQEVIAIVEICFYVPLFLLTLAVAFRHGFGRQLGWVFLCIFCAVRITGAAFEYEAIQNPTNTTDSTWFIILSSVGLSPLFLATMGLIKRIADETTANGVSQRGRVIQILRIPTILALILCVVGGEDQTKANDPSKNSTGKTLTKVGIVIFVAIYVAIFVLTLITGKDVRNTPRRDRPMYFVVLVSLPLLACRLLFSILSSFTTNPSFQLGGPQPLVQLFMATVEEFIIVVLYTLAGLVAPGKNQQMQQSEFK